MMALLHKVQETGYHAANHHLITDKSLLWQYPQGILKQMLQKVQ